MSKVRYTVLAVVIIAAVPVSVFGDTFYQKTEYARQQVASRPQEQLDSMNDRVFTDAFIAAKIVGFDRNEVDQLKRDIQALRDENAQLRAQIAARPTAVGAPSLLAASAGLETRVAALESEFNGLQSTLGTVVTMLTMLLSKFQ